MDKSKIDWQRLAEKELRGKSVEELDWTTLEGIKVKPVYSEEDLFWDEIMPGRLMFLKFFHFWGRS